MTQTKSWTIHLINPNKGPVRYFTDAEFRDALLHEARELEAQGKSLIDLEWRKQNISHTMNATTSDGKRTRRGDGN